MTLPDPDFASVLVVNQLSYRVVALLATEIGPAALGVRCGGPWAVALIGMRATGGLESAPVPPGLPLLDVLRRVLRANPRRRLLSWDTDFVPIGREADLIPVSGAQQ